MILMQGLGLPHFFKKSPCKITPVGRKGKALIPFWPNHVRSKVPFLNMLRSILKKR
jgi:hypothetical protein